MCIYHFSNSLSTMTNNLFDNSIVYTCHSKKRYTSMPGIVWSMIYI